jgi:hypothetical protein
MDEGEFPAAEQPLSFDEWKWMKKRQGEREKEGGTKRGQERRGEKKKSGRERRREGEREKKRKEGERSSEAEGRERDTESLFVTTKKCPKLTLFIKIYTVRTYIIKNYLK